MQINKSFHSLSFPISQQHDTEHTTVQSCECHLVPKPHDKHALHASTTVITFTIFNFGSYNVLHWHEFSVLGFHNQAASWDMQQMSPVARRNIWLVYSNSDWQKVCLISFLVLPPLFQMLSALQLFARWTHKINPKDLGNVPPSYHVRQLQCTSP